MTKKDEPDLMIVVSGSDVDAKQVLAAAYGAGLIKQGIIVGSYPPPSISGRMTSEGPNEQRIDRFKFGGTVTGRFSSKDPNVSCEPRSELASIDYSSIEKRILSAMTEQPDFKDPAAKWYGIDKRSLGPIDQARRFTDLYGMSSTQFRAQALSSATQMSVLHDRLTAAGFKRGEGAASDEYTRVEPMTKVNIKEMLDAAGIDASQRPGWENHLIEDGYVQSKHNPDVFTKENSNEEF